MTHNNLLAVSKGHITVLFSAESSIYCILSHTDVRVDGTKQWRGETNESDAQ